MWLHGSSTLERASNEDQSIFCETSTIRQPELILTFMFTKHSNLPRYYETCAFFFCKVSHLAALGMRLHDDALDAVAGPADGQPAHQLVPLRLALRHRAQAPVRHLREKVGGHRDDSSLEFMCL